MKTVLVLMLFSLTLVGCQSAQSITSLPKPPIPGDFNITQTVTETTAAETGDTVRTTETTVNGTQPEYADGKMKMEFSQNDDGTMAVEIVQPGTHKIKDILLEAGDTARGWFSAPTFGSLEILNIVGGIGILAGAVIAFYLRGLGIAVLGGSALLLAISVGLASSAQYIGLAIGIGAFAVVGMGVYYLYHSFFNRKSLKQTVKAINKVKKEKPEIFEEIKPILEKEHKSKGVKNKIRHLKDDLDSS